MNISQCQLSEQILLDMRSRVVPLVVKEASDAPRSIRVWIPECGRGESVYAIACLIAERRPDMGFKIFGTDPDADNIARARNGVYDREPPRVIPEDLVSRFFGPSESGYQIRRDVRDRCIFSQHNPLVDPPISKLDLIIWMKPPDAAFDKRILPLLHYALRPGGLLWCCEFNKSEKGALFFNQTPVSADLQRKRFGPLPVKFSFTGGVKPAMPPAPNGLQATIEELTIAQEELQTSNEELTTINVQLEDRNSELSESNTVLNGVVESLGMPVVLVDEKSRIRAFNHHARNIFNIRREDVGRHVADLQPRFQLPDVSGLVKQVIETKQTHEEEILDATQRWNLLRIKPYKREGGAIAGAILAVLDVHELRMSKEREKEARAEAEKANAAKDQFLSTLSHELRTPLTPILAWTQMLRSKNLDRDATVKALEIIERAVKTQRQLIDDLLDVSRIVAGKFALNQHPIALADVLRSAIETIRPAADAKAITIEQDIGADAPVFGDPMRLQQVFWNILINAVRFSHEHGRIEVRLRRHCDEISVDIADNGEGIAPHELPLIFERFKQVDSSTTRRHSGLGLGLSIARSIVELHGGQIRAGSRGKGQGATITVALPACREQPVAPKIERANERLTGVRILLVDDDADTLDSIAYMLNEAGANVQIARSAAEALESLRVRTPDVIICDLGMPGEDGYSLIRKIRREPPLDLIPAIALTAYAGEENRRAALEAGFHAHLSKPVDFEKVTAAICSLVMTV